MCWTLQWSIPDRGKRFLSSQKISWAHPTSYSMGTGFLSQVKAAGGVNLTTHLHLVPRLRMGGAMHLFPLYVPVTWTRTTFFTFVWPCIVTNFFIIEPNGCTNFPYLLRTETLHVLDSFSAHRQEFIHCTLSNVIKPTRCANFTNLFCHETLHVSDSSSAHHQEFIHCTLSNGICHTGL